MSAEPQMPGGAGLSRRRAVANGVRSADRSVRPMYPLRQVLELLSEKSIDTGRVKTALHSNARRQKSYIRSGKFGTLYDLVLIAGIQLGKIAAPAPNADDQVGVIFRMLLGV